MGNLQQFKNNENGAQKILRFLGIVQIKEEPRNNGIGSYIWWRCNPWNPLSYIVLMVSIPIAIFNSGWHDTKRSLKNIFTWQ